MTLIEATISVLVVSIMLVAAMNLVGGARMADLRLADRARGMMLAQDLMTEILQQAYVEPGAGSGSFGTGADEAATGDRSLFDDVDDYYNWEASPPQHKDGTVMSELSGWKRRVQVLWVSPGNLDTAIGTDVGFKRIWVGVFHRDAKVAELRAIRSTGWMDTLPEGDDTSGVAGNTPPQAVASGVPLSGPAPLIVAFDASASNDPDLEDAVSLTYEWDFGDGTHTEGVLATHIFSQGIYTVTLTVSDGRGGTGTDTLTVTAN